jgi:hypothetical protein
VLGLSSQAADWAVERGDAWRAPRLKLRRQIRTARRWGRQSVLPFQKWWTHLAGEQRAAEARLSAALAAERAGYRRNGRADTGRLLRGLGLADRLDGQTGRWGRNRFVDYETGLALCRALDRDPVELGL